MVNTVNWMVKETFWGEKCRGQGRDGFNPNALLLHIKQVHKGQKQFKCNICTAGALLLSNLQLVPGRDNIRDVGL